MAVAHTGMKLAAGASDLYVSSKLKLARLWLPVNDDHDVGRCEEESSDACASWLESIGILLGFVPLQLYRYFERRSRALMLRSVQTCL